MIQRREIPERTENRNTYKREGAQGCDHVKLCPYAAHITNVWAVRVGAALTSRQFHILAAFSTPN